MPLTKNILPATISNWQFWRMTSIYLPHGGLTEEPLLYQCTEKSIRILKQDSTVGEWKDWMHDFMEKRISDLPANTGNTLYLDKEIIQSLCEEIKMNFRWFFKLSCFSGERNYEKYETSHLYNQFIGTNIMLL